MLDLATATLADFLPALQQEFELITGTGGIALMLTSAEPKGAASAGHRAPFSLFFQGAPVLRLPQAIYPLQNVTLGAMELFLVQVGADAAGSYFEAAFS